MNEWQHLDRQLKELFEATHFEIPVFSSSNLNYTEMATGLANDLRRVLKYARLEWPDIVEELSLPISLSDRYNALLGYYSLKELGNISNPVLQRASVIVQLYFDLIYFRDQILVLLRKIILQSPERFGKLEYLSQWLEIVGDTPFANKLRALRNGFAHGKWAYFPDYSGLVFFPEKSPPYTRHELTQDELNLIHGLLYGFQLVFFQIAREELFNG